MIAKVFTRILWCVASVVGGVALAQLLYVSVNGCPRWATDLAALLMTVFVGAVGWWMVEGKR